MRYLPPVYRPPSEANSLILQITYGCSHNQCSFCAMYKNKPFKLRPLDDILNDIVAVKSTGYKPKRIFLADGDALIMPYPTLSRVLSCLKETFENCERISAYASPRSIVLKTPEELAALKSQGLDLLYVGIESGSNVVLESVRKGYSSEALKETLLKAKAAGFSLSTMLISGLGGQSHWEVHALESAKIINAVEPDFISLLTLMLEPGTGLYEAEQAGHFKCLTPLQTIEETLLFLSNLKVSKGIFRSNHASNYLNLAGNLPEDLHRLVNTLEGFLQNGGLLKPDYLRGL